MRNIYKISGRLIDKNKKPLDNLKVKASRCSFLRDDKLGDSITDSDGAFEISYSDDHQNSSPEDIKLEISIENEPVKTISAKKEGLNLDFCTITIDAKSALKVE